MMHWYVYSRWTWNLAPTSFTGGLVVLRWEKKWWILHCWKIFILRVGGYFCFFLFLFIKNYKKIDQTITSSFYLFCSAQVLPTHQSVFRVSRDLSVESLAPPHVNPVLGTPILAMVPVPALPVTPALSMQVWIKS